MVLEDIFRRNAASTDPAQAVPLNLLSDLASQIDSAAADYAKLREYWDGKHPVKLTTRLKQFLTNNGITDIGFNANFMGVVISAATDRMAVSGFTVAGEDTGDKKDPGKVGPLAQYATDNWAINRADAMQKEVHGDAMALGDAFVIAEWDEAAKGVVLNFNPPEFVRIFYDDDNYLRPVLAVKKWVTTTTVEQHADQSMRMNLYYDDRIEKFVSMGAGGGSWKRHFDHLPDEEGNQQWPVPWTDNEGNPLGIPVVHFRNNPRGNSYGRSELLDVIPLQDAMNKALVDGLRVMDAQGWPQRYATGLGDTKTSDVQANPGALMVAGPEGAKFGEFDPASPDGVIKWMEHIGATIATLTKSPQHLFRITGGAPSGEALKTAEAPMVRKIGDRQTVYGNGWEDVQSLSIRIANANGETMGDLPDTGITAEWENAETRPDELARIGAINAKQGISIRQRFREYGYTDEEIDRIVEELEEEPNDIADSLARAFDRGGGAAEGGEAITDGSQ